MNPDSTSDGCLRAFCIICLLSVAGWIYTLIKILKWALS